MSCWGSLLKCPIDFLYKNHLRITVCVVGGGIDAKSAHWGAFELEQLSGAFQGRVTAEYP